MSWPINAGLCHSKWVSQNFKLSLVLGITKVRYDSLNLVFILLTQKRRTRLPVQDLLQQVCQSDSWVWPYLVLWLHQQVLPWQHFGVSSKWLGTRPRVFSKPLAIPTLSSMQTGARMLSAPWGYPGCHGLLFWIKVSRCQAQQLLCSKLFCAGNPNEVFLI